MKENRINYVFFYIVLNFHTLKLGYFSLEVNFSVSAPALK